MKEDKLLYLDGWRGLAIISLLIGHFLPVPGINFGAFGVNLFFVLSGLLMARILYAKQTPIPLFYKRRISRIFPAFYCFLLLVTLAFLGFGKSFNWKELITAALLTNNYLHDDFRQSALPFGHIWSICVEEHSYILLSIAAVLGRRSLLRPSLFVGSAVLFFALCACGYYWGSAANRNDLYNLWLHSEVAGYGIFASAFLFLIITRLRLPERLLRWELYLALVAAAVCCHWWSVPAPLRTIFGVGALALCVNLLHGAPPFLKELLSWTPLRYLGTWSFSIYLWQQPFYLAAHRKLLSVPCALALAMGAALLSFYCLESPLRRYLNRTWASETAPAAAPSPGAANGVGLHAAQKS